MSKPAHEDYYRELSLPPTPNTPYHKDMETCFHHYQESVSESHLRSLITEIDSVGLQKSLQTAVDKLVADWSDRYNTLVDTLNELEHHKVGLEQRIHIQSHRYERCLREIQMFHRQQHRSGQAVNVFPRRRSSNPHSSNASLLSSSSAHSSSCSSSVYTTFSLPEESSLEIITAHLGSGASSVFEHTEQIELDQDVHVYSSIATDDTPTNNLRNSSVSSSSSSSSNSSCSNSTRHSHSSYTDKSFVHSEEQCVTPTNASQITITATLSNTQQYSLPTVEDSEKVLTFACGDGFWNTIAHGKLNKSEVDTLVGNYLRRGGNPDVAKNSETVKNVKEGYSLIHALVAIKNTAALQKVIAAGAKANIYPLTRQKEDWVTPLMLAVKSGYLHGVELLLKSGESSLLCDRGPFGETTLHAAIQSGSEDMTIYVLRATQHALIEKTDQNGATPLHYACIAGKTRLISVLIREFQSQTDLKDHKGETPLHYAVRNRKLRAITKLVGELGAYPNPYILKQVPTPLDLAKSGGLKSIADYLRSVGAKTTKEMEKSSRATTSALAVNSSGSSTFSGDSGGSGDSVSSQTTLGVRQFLQSKTSQILKGPF